MNASDPRAKCALCLELRQLCSSHIYPNAIYKRIKSQQLSGSSLIEISSEPGVKVARTQDTKAERLLCGRCETTISRYEREGLRILRGGAVVIKTESGITFPRLDYSQFKLFTTSLIWRASVASSQSFMGVRLPEDVQENSRRSLETGNALDPACLGVRLARMTDSTPEGGFDNEALKNFIALPFVRWISPIRHIVLMVMEGFVLEFHVPKARLSTQRDKGFLSNSQSLQVPFQCVFQIPEMVEMMRSGMEKHMNGLVTFES